MTLLAAVLLAALPIFETGTGVPWTDSDGGLSGISPIGLIVILGGAAASFALFALAAPLRFRRIVAGCLGVAGFVILPTDILGGLGGGYSWPLASWMMFAGLTAIILLLAAAVLGVPRSRFTLALLAAAPPLSALGIVVVLQGVELPADVVNDVAAVPRLALSEAINGAGALAGAFSILAIWGVIEYSKGLGATSSRFLGLAAGWAWVVPGAAALKLAWVAAVSAGWAPTFITPNALPMEVIGNESPLSLVLAVVFVAILAIAAARRWLPAGGAEMTTGVFWLIVVPIIAAFVMPPIAMGIVTSAHRFAGRLHAPPPDQLEAFQMGLGEWHATVLGAITDFHPILVDAAPLISALTALAVAGLLWRRHRRRAAAAPFLAAYGIWTLIPAVSAVLLGWGVPVWDSPPDAGGGLALLGNVHPMTLDLGVTVLVLGLGVLAARRRAGPVGAPLLLALLATSTVIAYGDQFTPASLAVILFWIGLAFPVFVQYGLDAVALNRPGHDRAAKILFALAGTLLAISASYAAILVGAVAPGDVSTSAMVRQLALMPLALTFVLAYASHRDARTLERGE